MVAAISEPASPSARLGPPRREVFAFLELWAIAGLAVAQPALDLLAKNVGILLADEASSFEVVVLCFAVLLIPPAIAYGIEIVIGLVGARTRTWCHAGLVGGFAGLFIGQVLGRAGVGTAVVVVGGTLTGVAAVALMVRVAAARTYLRVLAVAPVLFAVLFLTSSPASAIVFPGAATGVSGAAIAHPKRVVMIVLDELPLEALLDGHGRIDAELYPQFARLAGASTWYRNDTTVHGFTEYAVPALLTGRRPTDRSAVPTAADYPESIFRLLGGAYRMNVHETVTRLCPTSICVADPSRRGVVGTVGRLLRATTDLWTSSLGDHQPASTPLAPIVGGDRRVPMTNFVNSLSPSAKPTFDFAHVLMPHQPWQYLPTLQDAGTSADDQALARANILQWGSPWATWIGRQREGLQLQATDRFVGQVIDRLQSIGAWKDSLVVVTADHGAAFTVGEPIRWVKDRNAAQILWTPLFVKTPGQVTGAVDDRPVESIDVVPTMADILGVRIPWTVDGRSVRGAPRAEFPRRFAQWDLRSPSPPPAVPFAPNTGTLTFDATSLFPSVLRAQPVAPGPDPGLRPYAIGPYANLLGRETASLDGAADAPVGTVSVGDPARFDGVDPAAPTVPWTWIEGRATGIVGDRPLAIAVNGRIAGLTSIDARGSNVPGYFLVTLAPWFFVAGHNDVTAFVVSGPAASARLTPVTVVSGAGTP